MALGDLGRSARSRLAVAITLALAGCAAPPAAAPVAPPRPPKPEPPAFSVDALPGSVVELEALAADPAAGDRARDALVKLASIHRAAALASADRSPHDAAAARALRRLFARDRAFARARGLEAELVAALLGAGALAEADALLRHVACPSRFGYATAPDGVALPLAPLPQDHDARFWEAWERYHPEPLDTPRARAMSKGATAKPAPLPAGGPASLEDETRYVSLYAACPAEPALAEGAEARSAAWRAVAEAHLARDAAGGPFVVLRALEALSRAVDAAAPAPRSPAMRAARLGLGEALWRVERYRAASEELVRALALCEDAAACAPGERDRAVALLADSLARVDFEGPPADAPVIARLDALDTEVDPAAAGRKLRVGLVRAEDGRLVPQGRAFVPALLAALADQYRELGFFEEARLAFTRLRERFPQHRELPRVLEAMARLAADTARTRRAALAAPDHARAVALWDELALLLAPRSAWREANAADVDALAEGARRAREAVPALADALEATASAIDAAAVATGALPFDDATAVALLARARDAWRPLATPGKAGVRARAVLASVSAAELAWLARTAPAVDLARWAESLRALEAVRDDPEGVEGRMAAARRVVEVADRHVRYDEARFTASRGALGLAPRARTLAPPLRTPVIEELPAVVGDAGRARDGLADAAAAAGATAERVEALVGAAGLLFAYGHTVPAGRRLAAASAAVCHERGGFATWRLAAEVARAGRDAGELARLAAEHADPLTTCAKTPTEKAAGRALVGPPRAR